MAGEYRGVKGEQTRHNLLRSQIRRYRRRLILLNRASSVAAVALLSFLLAVLADGLSMIDSLERCIRALGTIGLGRA
jgi:hypothetical protein